MTVMDATANSYTHSAFYRYTDMALRSRWAPFLEIVSEFDTVKKEADAGSGEWVARHMLVLDRLMIEYVSVILFAHTLCESVINATLAIGLAKEGTPDIFLMLERSDLREKIITGPKTFFRDFSFPSGTALDETLCRLIKERNNIVHYKVYLEMGGKLVASGTNILGGTNQEIIAWIRRFFSLPFDISDVLRCASPEMPWVLIGGSDPIERVDLHLPKELRTQRVQ